jgi:zinc finger protein 423
MCFICDETIVGHASIITETETTSSHEKITKKIAKMVGDSFCVIVSEDDCICRRCLSLFNSMDKAEYDLETYRSRLRGFVNKKYGIEDDEPPSKVQRMSAMDSSVRSASESFKLRNESQSNLTSSPPKKGPMKLYKCIACDFKTTDLNAFQPHSSVCKGNPNRAKTPPPRQTTVVQSRMQIMNTNRLQKVGETTITRNVAQTQKTTQQRTPPQRAVPKLRPYKCKMCLERFETRESAQIHARIHTSQLKSNQERRIQIQNSSNQNRAPTQKPLTEIIKEALSEDDQEGEVLEFHSCTECSLTFVNKKLYIQHMKTHDNSTEKSIEKNQSQYNKSQDTLGDLESIFEKMHSENSHTTATNGDKNVMVTTQEGGITYNITIPQDEDIKEDNRRIDMPSLSSHDNEEVHVSMPSLHDDERSQEEKELQGEEVPMDLEEMPGSEGQQLKFIVDENGQFLQLDNHILTTDAEGNQILVGVDGNQVLVQLQGGDESLDSEGAIQMALSGQGEGQGLILVQGPDGESQLIGKLTVS